MDKTSQEIALDSDVLHATKHDFPLFYNKDFDLGKHLGIQSPIQKEFVKNNLKEDTIEKKMTSPIVNNHSSEKFLFIKK